MDNRRKNGIIVIYKGGMPNIAQMDLVQWNEMKGIRNYVYSPNMSIIGVEEEGLPIRVYGIEWKYCIGHCNIRDWIWSMSDIEPFGSLA